jgi:putative transposase
MPRTARITVENGCYHIITRGNQKQSVFLEPYDYERYLSFIKKYKKKFRFKLYCFCLMPNHVHLVIELQNPPMLNRIMRGLNLSYTRYFNFKYKKVGHLWQDRFKSKIIEKDAYLLECINYIESNPVRAFLSSHIKEYHWSSYNFREVNHELIDSLFSL